MHSFIHPLLPPTCRVPPTHSSLHPSTPPFSHLPCPFIHTPSHLFTQPPARLPTHPHTRAELHSTWSYLFPAEGQLTPGRPPRWHRGQPCPPSGHIPVVFILAQLPVPEHPLPAPEGTASWRFGRTPRGPPEDVRGRRRGRGSVAVRGVSPGPQPQATPGVSP